VDVNGTEEEEEEEEEEEGGPLDGVLPSDGDIERI